MSHQRELDGTIDRPRTISALQSCVVCPSCVITLALPHCLLLQDGLVYDIPGKSCNHPQRVECGKRDGELQEPQPVDGCPRLNGYFNPEDPAK